MSTFGKSAIPILGKLAVVLIIMCPGAYGQAPGIQITHPEDGAVHLPNETVALEIEPLGGVLLEQVLYVTRFSADAVDAPFFSNLTIPEDEIGWVKVAAFGRTKAGEFVSDEITIFVQPESSLHELSVEPQRLSFFREGQTRKIVVTGRYDGGLTRDLNAPGAGTTYSSSSNDVVSVTADGTMEARGIGSAVVTVVNSGKGAEVAVVVDLIAIPIAVVGDLDDDGDVDRDDLNVVLARRNTPASGPDDRADLNDDEMITVLDARVLVTLCTRARCAVN